MKKTIRLRLLRILYAVLLFAAGLFIFCRLMEVRPRASAQAVAAPTLPVVTMQAGDVSFNQLPGYISERNLAHFHPVLTPIGSDRQVSLSVNPFGTKVTGASYEVRTLSGDRLLEKTDITDLPADTTKEFSLSFTLKDLMNEDEEYVLDLVLSTEQQENIRYYTRVISSTDNDTASEAPLYQQAVAFAKEFHDKTVQGTDTGYLANYIEPEESGSALSTVDIHSSLDQITFLDLQPEEVVAPVFALTDISGTQVCLNDSYVLSVTDPDNIEVTHYYLCQEYYRINQGFDRFHLLNFQRTMTEIYDPETADITSDSIDLGIGDPDMALETCPDGSSIAFVSGGRLLMVDTDSSTIHCIYGEADPASTDPREQNADHGIRILSVDNDGDVNFLVYGYMNSGAHEGNVGVAEYQYTTRQHTIEEKAYLSYDGSYELLRSQVESGAYLNDAGQLYLLLDDVQYDIDVTDRKLSLQNASLRGSDIVSSGDGRMTAWKEAGTAEYGTDSGDIVFTDLLDYSQQRISPEDGEKLVVIGFMDDDLIYGIAREADQPSEGTRTLMYRLEIVDHDQQTLEDYQADGFYVTDAVIEDNQVTLHRVQQTDSGYAEAADDQIVNTTAGGQKSSSVLAEQSDGSFGEVLILSASGFRPGQARYAAARELTRAGVNTDLTQQMQELLAESRDTAAEGQSSTTPGTAGDGDSGRMAASAQRFYVYGMYGYDRSYQNPSDAILRATQNAGAVVGADGNYVWRRASADRCQLDNVGMDADYRKQIRDGSLSAEAACLDAVLRLEGSSADAAALLEQGEDTAQILEENIQNATALDLTGCTMENILYYPSIGIPVIAQTSSGPVLIIGYGPERIAIWNPASGEEVTLPGRSAASRQFTAAGNRFVTYVKAAE